MADSFPPFARPFTARQRRGLLIFCVLLLALSLMALVLSQAHIPDPLPPAGHQFEELEDRIDPNTADASLLAALPALGEKRAAEIVMFRERAKNQDPNHIAFQEPKDLMQVRGIGPAIVQQISPFLRFSAAPATYPVD